MAEQHRPKVLVAGAGGSIGSAVSRALAHEYDIVALHDFKPVLPWGLYFISQAFAHLFVMRNFQKYMALVASNFPQKN